MYIYFLLSFERQRLWLLSCWNYSDRHGCAIFFMHNDGRPALLTKIKLHFAKNYITIMTILSVLLDSYLLNLMSFSGQMQTCEIVLEVQYF